ncbi:MAG: RNA methyltransferase [Bacteroidota bacterium]
MRKLKNEELVRKTVEEYKKAKKTPLIIVLDNVRSLNNVGSVFRTADSFLVESVYLCGITATPPHRDIQKTALGATESVDWKYFNETKDAIDRLRLNNYKISAIEQTENSIALNEFSLEKDQKYAVIFGHEVKGIDQDIINLCDFCLEIPQFGTKHSLNIAVSVGVVVWDLFIKLNDITSQID